MSESIVSTEFQTRSILKTFLVKCASKMCYTVSITKEKIEGKRIIKTKLSYILKQSKYSECISILGKNEEL